MSHSAAALPAPDADIAAGRLSPQQLAENFADAQPPLSALQAVLEAERCLYCHNAPCVQACPTAIPVPHFIRRIAEDNLRGAARAILEANPLGGSCARACPTEELCEAVCVKVAQEGRPVAIGRLQRHATDAVMDRPAPQLLSRAAPTGRRIAVVGAGPAGLACAVKLARLGHAVVIHDAGARPGGLNRYGLASYKMADDFAGREIDWLLGLGGIEIVSDWRLREAAQLQALRSGFDAVFLGIGLGRAAALGIPGTELAGVRDAVDFIAELRESADKATLPVGRRVVVIGGGMTAVDAAVQARLLGAEQVTMVYRRGPEAMGASQVERDWARTRGVTIRHHLAPEALLGEAGHVQAVRFAVMRTDAEGRATPTGHHETLEADMVLSAIGQKLDVADWLADSGLALDGDKLAADADGRTALPDVWIGGDCQAGGRDLTVEAVAGSQRAAASIDAALRAAV